MINIHIMLDTIFLKSMFMIITLTYFIYHIAVRSNGFGKFILTGYLKNSNNIYTKLFDNQHKSA